MIVFLAITSICAFAESDENNGVRDPTIPLGYSSGYVGSRNASELVLDSVLISPNRKLAIINGEILREGQALAGASGIKVQRILPQTVVLQQGEKTWVLNLSPSVITKH